MIWFDNWFHGKWRGHISAITSVDHAVTEVMIFKISLPKNLAKILAFFAQTAASFCKK
jgi:hypothetical protein